MHDITLTGHALKALIRRLPHDGTNCDVVQVHVTDGGTPIMWGTDRYHAWVYSDRQLTGEELLKIANKGTRLGGIHLDELQKIAKLEKPSVPMTLSFGARGFEASAYGDTGDHSCIVENWHEALRPLSWPIDMTQVLERLPHDGTQVDDVCKLYGKFDLQYGPTAFAPKIMEGIGHLAANLGVARDRDGRKQSPYPLQYLGQSKPSKAGNESTQPTWWYIRSKPLGSKWSNDQVEAPIGETFSLLVVWMPIRIPEGA